MSSSSYFVLFGFLYLLLFIFKFMNINVTMLDIIIILFSFFFTFLFSYNDCHWKKRQQRQHSIINYREIFLFFGRLIIITNKGVIAHFILSSFSLEFISFSFTLFFYLFPEKKLAPSHFFPWFISIHCYNGKLSLSLMCCAGGGDCRV